MEHTLDLMMVLYRPPQYVNYFSSDIPEVAPSKARLQVYVSTHKQV